MLLTINIGSRACLNGSAVFAPEITGSLLEDPHLMVTCLEMFIPAINLTSVDLFRFMDKVNFTVSYSPGIQPLMDVGQVSANVSRKALTAAATQDVTPEFMELYTKRVNRANINVKAEKELYKETSALLQTHYQLSALEDPREDVPEAAYRGIQA